MNSIRMRLVLGLLLVAGLVGFGAAALLLSSTEQRMRAQLRSSLLAELRLGGENMVLELTPQGRERPPEEGPPAFEGTAPPNSQGPEQSALSGRKRFPFGTLAEKSEHLYIASAGQRRISSPELEGIELPEPKSAVKVVEFSDLALDTVRFGTITLPELKAEFLHLEAVFYAPVRGNAAAQRRAERDLPARPRRPIRVSLLADTFALREAHTALVSSMALTGLVAAILTMALVLVIVGRSLAPLKGLRDQLDGLDAESLTRRVQLADAPLELKPVVEEVNSLLQRMQSAFEREKAFLGDAAHELRTPIAGLRATLELARSRPRSSEEYQRVTGDCLAMTLDMQKLVEGLFDLALPLNVEAAMTRVELNLEQELRFAAERLGEEGDRRLELSVDTAGSVHVSADLVLLRTVLSNLLQNCLSHGRLDPETKAVLVSATLKSAGKGAQLVLSNAAEGLAPETGQRAFDPFWRADTARSGEGKHAGIGLALCQRAAKAMGGEVRARVEGDRFIVTLDLAASR